MATKCESVYTQDLDLQGDIRITLSAEERMILSQALIKCAKDEVDILPLLSLANRLVTGS